MDNYRISNINSLSMYKKIVVLLISWVLMSCQNIKNTKINEPLIFESSPISVQTAIPTNIILQTMPAISPESIVTKIPTKNSDFIRTIPKTDYLNGIITITTDQKNILIDFNKYCIYKLNCNNPDYKSNDICLINSYRIQLSGHPIEIKRLNSNFLVVFESLENHKYNIYKFDNKTESLNKIYTIDMINDLWLALPKVSNDTLKIVGVKNKGQWDNPLTFINLNKANEQEVILEPPYFMTYNLAWSPSDQKILVGASNVQMEIGFCTNLLLVYNESLSKIAQFSSGKVKCFDDFDLIARSNTTTLWSPDEKNIVVIADHKDLCLANIEELSINCFTPVNQLNEEIRSIVWSPDSNFIAFITTGKKPKINIIDVQNYETVLIENLDGDFAENWFELNWQGN